MAKQAPPVNGDFFDIFDTLNDKQTRASRITEQFLREHVRPIINDYWDRGEFPQQLIPKTAVYLQELYGPHFEFTYPLNDPVTSGIISLQLGRLEPSFSTFLGVHIHLCMASIALFGSDAQKAQWLPAMWRMEKIGSWALTEPLHGSDASSGLETTARRQGDSWILNGQKKWSGNATFADVNIIWAKNENTGQVNGFIVEKGTPGYHVEKLTGKIAKRAVENVLITLTDVEIPLSNQLPGVKSFADVGKQLAIARGGVAWEAVGLAMGAYEAALHYANERVQFGRPLTSFQMVQHNLVQMLGNVTAMQTMMLRMAQLQERDGLISHERASLAKAWCTRKMRETVAIAREVLGGNGILIEYEVARLFADAEAVYSYEGTYDMNVLITGRAITGQSAFL